MLSSTGLPFDQKAVEERIPTAGLQVASHNERMGWQYGWGVYDSLMS